MSCIAKPFVLSNQFLNPKFFNGTFSAREATLKYKYIEELLILSTTEETLIKAVLYYSSTRQ